MNITNNTDSFTNIPALNDVVHKIAGTLNVRNVCRLAQVSKNLQKAVEFLWDTNALDTPENRDLMAKFYTKKYSEVMETSTLMIKQSKENYLDTLSNSHPPGFVIHIQKYHKAFSKALDEIAPSLMEKVNELIYKYAMKTFTLNEIKTMCTLFQNPVFVSGQKKMMASVGGIEIEMPKILKELNFETLMQRYIQEYVG